MASNFKLGSSHEGTSVVLGFGPQDMDFFSRAMKVCGKKSVMDPDVARMAGANFAIGMPEDLARLRELLGPGSSLATQAQYPGMPLAALQWLAMGERGASSETLFQCLMGVTLREDDFGLAHYPVDPADFRRCRLMLEAIGHSDLTPARGLSKEWVALVDAWPELCALMDEECLDWRVSSGIAPKTYARIRTLIGR